MREVWTGDRLQVRWLQIRVAGVWSAMVLEGTSSAETVAGCDHLEEIEGALEPSVWRPKRRGGT